MVTHSGHCSSYRYTTWPQPGHVPWSSVSPFDLPSLPFGQNCITNPFLNNPWLLNRIHIIFNQIRFSSLNMGRIQSHLMYMAALLPRRAVGKYQLGRRPKMSLTTWVFKGAQINYRQHSFVKKEKKQFLEFLNFIRLYFTVWLSI